MSGSRYYKYRPAAPTSSTNEKLIRGSVGGAGRRQKSHADSDVKAGNVTISAATGLEHAKIHTRRREEYPAMEAKYTSMVRFGGHAILVTV